MNLIFRKFSPLYCLCIIAGCLIFTSCEDVVRRLDDKYRPVEPELMRSVTVITDGIDSSGVPLRLTNLDIADLELKATDAGGAAVPFTPKLEADKTHEGLAYIRIPPNGNPTTEFSVTVDICSKADGTVYASHTFTADTFPWRVFKVDGETYKFELKKLYHCDGGSGNPENNSPTYEGEEMTFKDSIMTLEDKQNKDRAGTTVVCKHTGNFVNNGYDYFEIKFRSAANVASVIKLTGSSSFTFTYDSGALLATGGSGLPADKLNYDDSSSDWVTLGFWNSATDDKCLFVEDFVGTAGTATAAYLTSNTSHNGGIGFASFNVDSDDDSPTEVDYVAFFKRVSE